MNNAEHFDIRFDPRDPILFLRLSGFWTLPIALAFEAALQDAGRDLRLAEKCTGTLSDSRAFPVQSEEVGAVLARIRLAGPGHEPWPTAIVVGSALNKLQAERVMKRDNVRVFLDMDEARAWLRARTAK